MPVIDHIHKFFINYRPSCANHFLKYFPAYTSVLFVSNYILICAICLLLFLCTAIASKCLHFPANILIAIMPGRRRRGRQSSKGTIVLAAGRSVWHVTPVAPLQWTLIIPAGVGPRNSCQIRKISQPPFFG